MLEYAQCVTATGVHDHPTRKLGARPEDTSRVKLPFAEFLRVAPTHPLVDEIPVLDYPMDRNDEAGDCVVAGGDHALQLILTQLTGSYTNWTDDQLLHAYQTQNPDFHSWADAETDADGGMVIAEFLSWMVKQGLILGYAKVDPQNDDEVRAAIYLGLAVVTGEDLQKAQQTGTTWDYVPGSPDWGGHCTVWGGYSTNDQLVSWGSGGYRMTGAFIAHRVTEAYFVLTTAHVEHPGFRDGFDLPKFGAAYTAITGRPFPYPVTPSPTPPTPPTPDPGAASFPGADPEVDRRVVATAHRAKLTVPDWLNHHFRQYFR